ncbi:MAG: ATP-binding protein [Bacteroidales bacterium]|nr:ATP-binding protein [Bacteroidales bacterium]
MKKAFVYGMSVEGVNFTDRVAETKRLKANFENGVNSIIISPRRMGKTSLVKRVMSQITDPDIKVAYMDIYDCRSEYDFYNRFASTILKATAGHVDNILSSVKQFLERVSPKISLGNDIDTEISLSLGITPDNYSPEEILNLPEKIAEKKNIMLVVCIDEFQQIGEFNDSLSVQKRMRGIWQHHQNVSYCMFGSKKHLMSTIFQSKKMPFYQFGDMIILDKISVADWTSFIVDRFGNAGKTITSRQAEWICMAVDCYSSYVQQLAWNVVIASDEEVADDDIRTGINDLLNQNRALFEKQVESLTAYQMNFLKAVCNGIEDDFGSARISTQYNLGTKSNISRLKETLLDKELIDIEHGKIRIADPVFSLWFKRDMMG